MTKSLYCLFVCFPSEGAEGMATPRTNKLLSNMPRIVLVYMKVVSVYS